MGSNPTSGTKEPESPVGATGAKVRAGHRARGGSSRPAVLVFAIALLLHGVSWVEDRGDPFRTQPLGDALSYHLWAERLAARGLATEGVFHQAPLYPLMLGALYRWVPGGARLDALQAVQAVLTSAAIALLVPLGATYLGSKRAGVLGAVLALAHGPFLLYSLRLLPVPLALATLASAWCLLGLARERGACGWYLLAGFATGGAALVRNEMLLALPVAALAARPWQRAAWVVLGGALAIAPVSAHNLRRGDFVLIASAGGENFFIGNQRGATGGYTGLHPRAGDVFSERALAQRLAEQALGRSLEPSEVSAYWARRALEEIAADPLAWLRLEARKLARILHPGEPTEDYSFALERQRFHPSWRLLSLPPWSLLLLGAAGAWLAWTSHRRQAWPLLMLAGVQVGVLLLFFVNSRLRLSVLYLGAPLAGFAAEYAVHAWRKPRERWRAGAALALLGLASALSAILWRPSPRDHLRLAALLSSQGRLEEARDALAPALAFPRPDGLVLDQAGWIEQKAGRPREAAALYQRALQEGSPPLPAEREPSTRTRLAQVLERLGREEDAAAEHDRAAGSPHAHAGTFYERALFRLRRNDTPGALSDLQRAVALDPDWPEPRDLLSRLEASAR